MIIACGYTQTKARRYDMMLVDGGLYCLKGMLKAFDFFAYALFY
jgi:hypothetical protein